MFHITKTGICIEVKWLPLQFSPLSPQWFFQSFDNENSKFANEKVLMSLYTYLIIIFSLVCSSGYSVIHFAAPSKSKIGINRAFSTCPNQSIHFHFLSKNITSFFQNF